ncbi:Rv3235 family protein [Wenjunlia vitaminophila]|uniref:Rv3235 family protein n=1 Tax=Wenjunlia vitaminophila TaxID=76728 RepID=UPI000478026E|nr:Rv3235 family protein [Wenjunlia vitaminophila]
MPTTGTTGGAGRSRARRGGPAPRGAGPGRNRPAGTGPGRPPGARPAVPGDLRHWFAQTLLEVLTGRRTTATLLRVVSGEVYQQVWTLTEEGRLRHRPGDPGPAVLVCRHCAPAPGVLEVGAVVQAAGRSRALAFRLERGGGRRWRCTALQTG